MPKWSWMTLARGAKQLVVQEALLERGRQVKGTSIMYHAARSAHFSTPSAALT